MTGFVRGVVRSLVWGGATGLGAALGALRLGLAVDGRGLVALGILVAALYRLIALTREGAGPLPLPRTVGGPPPDRPFERLDRLEDRLSWGIRTAHHFDSGVRPVLTGIAADRLRRRHGIDLAREPERARHLLGDDLWRLVTPAQPGPVRPPAPQELAGWVSRLESL